MADLPNSELHLSVVIPAHNEESRLPGTMRSVGDYLRRQTYRSEIIIVVNGCQDRTPELAAAEAKRLAVPVRVLNLTESGKGRAVKAGVLAASGEIIIFMDADNAAPIAEIEKFWPAFSEGYQVVIGSRYLDKRTVKRAQPLYRIILSRLSNDLIQLLLLPGIKDTQLGFKAFTRAAAQNIFSRTTIWRWGFDMEVLALARSGGYKIKEVPVVWTEYGHSGLPLRAYGEALFDLFRIVFKKY